MYILNLGHMTKMAAMPIYGKNFSNIFFSETNRLTSMKLSREASMAIVLQCIYKSRPCDDLDQVYDKVNMVCPCI